MTDNTASPELLARRDQLLAALRDLPNFMRGTFVQVRVRCGQPGCECARGGPKHLKTHLSVNLGGKTRTLYVNRERHDEIAALLAGYERLWNLVNELTAINLELLRGSRPASRRPRATTARRRS